MTPSQLIPGGCGELSELVNTERLRSSIRRLFQNKIAEVISECLQNSARARADQVSITTTETGFAIQDNGHGLLNGAEGFHILLRIAESYFDNPTIADQWPMGLGVGALLAHDKVTRVRFESAGLALSIDTSKWWSQSEYYSTWFERLEELAEPVAGLKIIVECDPTLVEKMKAALVPSQHSPSREYARTPAQGYCGILNITLDGSPVETGLPAWAMPRQVILSTEYMGCPLTIGYIGEHSMAPSSIRWYGQIVKTASTSPSFGFYLDVNEGRPVNPRSPVREGLIEDDAYHALIRFVRDCLFEHLCDTANRDSIKAEWIYALYGLDRERALKECPYMVVRRQLEVEDFDSVEEIDMRGDYGLFTYTAPPLLIKSKVNLFTGEKPSPQEHGICSFIPLVGDAYTLVCGDAARLDVKTIWWRPGKAIRDCFHQPGTWGLGTGSKWPRSWKRIGKVPVFTFNWPDCTDASGVDFTVGCEATDEAMLAFLDREVWAGWNPDSDTRDRDDLRDDYEDSIYDWVREIVGNCVSMQFKPSEVESFLQKDSRVAAIEFHYEGNAAHSITVTGTAGDRVTLKLL